MNLVRSLIVATFCYACNQAFAAHSETLNSYLSRHQLSECTNYFQSAVDSNPRDHDARLALGMTQFIQTVERLAQDLSKAGIREHRLRMFIPVLRIPVVGKTPSQPLSYAELRKIFERLQQGLAKAEKTLEAVDTQNCKLLIEFGNIPLDLDGNGLINDDEVFHKLLTLLNPNLRNAQFASFKLGFDGGDVHWLRGYMHLIMAFCDLFLAYDHRDLFERCGQLLFEKIESPFMTPSLSKDREAIYSPESIADVIAAVHLLRFSLKDRLRMANSHAHLLKVVEQSRLSWKSVLSEVDNDHEWIPNPKQQSILGINVPREFIHGWENVVTEIESLLQGQRLVFHWRLSAEVLPGTSEPSKRGINLKKFFLEPNDLDLVLAAQGTGVEQYLEEGTVSGPESWARLTQIFQGRFLGFAAWFN